MIQKSTGIKLIVIKEIDTYRVLCEYAENNCLYSKKKKGIFYKCDLRPITINDKGE